MPYGDFSGYWFAISRLLIPPFQTFIPLLMNDAADYPRFMFGQWF
jgi:hypothetical protein